MRFGSQAVQNLQNAFPHRCSPDDGVVDDDQRIRSPADCSVRDVVNMGDQIVAARVRRDERPQFGILDRHLFKARAVCKERFPDSPN